MSQLRKNISYNFLLSLAQLIFPVFSIPYISRVLSPDGLGRVNFVDSLSYYFVTLAGLGITSFGIREISRYRNNKNNLSKIVSELLSFNIAGGIIFLMIYWIVLFFVYPKINNFNLVIFSSIFIIANSFTCEWYFLGTEKFKYIAFRTFFLRLLGLICIFLFVKSTTDFYLYYLIMVCTMLFIAFWNLKILFSEITFCFSIRNWKQLFSKTRLMYFTSLMSCISLMLDNVLLGLVASTTAVAFYTLSSRVVRIGSSLITDSFYVLYPNSVAVLHNKEKSEYNQLVYNSFHWIFIITAPLCFGIFLSAEDFSNVYLGPDFKSVIIGIRILCIYPFFRIIGLFLNLQILMPHNQESSIFKSLLISVIIFVPVNLFLSYSFSFIGTCISLLISELSIVIANYYFARKKCAYALSYNGKTLLQVLTGILLFIPLYYYLKKIFHNQLVFLLVTVLTCGLVYFSFLLIIRNKFALDFFKTIKMYLTSDKPKNKYFIQQYLFDEKGFYGGIGFVDAEMILKNNSFIPIAFPFQNSFSLFAKIMRSLFLLKQFFSLANGSIITFIHPSYAKMPVLLLKLIKLRKSIKTICIIGDIDGIRDDNPQLLFKECEVFNNCDIIVAHNDRMTNWLSSKAKVNKAKIVQLHLFDFNTKPGTINRKLTSAIVFAGNVITNPFINKLHSIIKNDSLCEYNIYGNQNTGSVCSNNKLHYYLYESNPYKVPSLLKGSFGLIWYGEDLDECSGAMGEYVKYISQHKLSLYIVSGLPIIIWENAATGAFVKEHHIGFTIKSIYEIEDKIKNITEAQYFEMRENLKPLAQKISSGYFLTTAITEAILKLNGK